MTEELRMVVLSLLHMYNTHKYKSNRLIKVVLYELKIREYVGRDYSRTPLTNTVINIGKMQFKENNIVEKVVIEFEKKSISEKEDYLFTMVVEDKEKDKYVSMAYKDKHFIELLSYDYGVE